MGLLHLHNNLIKFLRTNLRKQKTKKDIIIFARQLTKGYLSALLIEYRRFLLTFNSEYRQQRHEFKMQQQFKKDINTAWKIIQWMIKQGEDRTQRKWIRRDFEKHGRITKETQDAILHDIYGVK